MQEKKTTVDFIQKHFNKFWKHRHMYGGPIVCKNHCLVDPQIRQSLVNQCTEVVSNEVVLL